MLKIRFLMKIILKETQLLKTLLEVSLAGLYGDKYAEMVKSDKEAIWGLLKNNGKLMVANDNDKIYKIYYLQTLSRALGRDYVICRLVHWDTMEEYGSTYVKPLKLFRTYDVNNFKEIGINKSNKKNIFL